MWFREEGERDRGGPPRGTLLRRGSTGAEISVGRMRREENATIEGEERKSGGPCRSPLRGTILQRGSTSAEISTRQMRREEGGSGEVGERGATSLGGRHLGQRSGRGFWRVSRAGRVGTHSPFSTSQGGKCRQAFSRSSYPLPAEARLEVSRPRDLPARGGFAGNPVLHAHSRWQRVVRRHPRMHPADTGGCRHCGWPFVGPSQGVRCQHMDSGTLGAPRQPARMQSDRVQPSLANALRRKSTPQQGLTSQHRWPASARPPYVNNKPASQPQQLVPQPAANKLASASSGQRPLTYAEMVVQGQADPVATANGGQRIRLSSEAQDRCVDPIKEGRCVRCLARGHFARDCRDPIKCRLCRQSGHRQVSCPAERMQRLSLRGLGLLIVWWEKPVITTHRGLKSSTGFRPHAPT